MLLAQLFSGFLLGKLWSWFGGFVVGGIVGLVYGVMVGKGKGLNPLKWLKSE